jgi:hypothetical protein
LLENNKDKVNLKSYVTDELGNVKWYDLGKYDKDGESKMPKRNK